jgi:hypothetical protein
MHVGGIFCHLAKAFDCVNHETVLTKLHFIGIQGSMLSWFSSYPTDGNQKIEIKSLNSIQSTYSKWGSIKHCIPQGSISRTLLFIIY